MSTGDDAIEDRGSQLFQGPQSVAQDLASSGALVQTVDQFKGWIRDEVRPVLPHEALACGHGHVHAAGIGMDYVITVDYPIEHLVAIRNRSGGIDTPILRRWLASREALLFDVEAPWSGVSEEWLHHFRQHRLINAAVHAVFDEQRCVGTYFSFHRLPKPLGETQRSVLNWITPVLHETLLRVIASHEKSTTSQENPLAMLSPRECEVMKWGSFKFRVG